MDYFSVSRGMGGRFRHTDRDEPILSHLNPHEKLLKVTISQTSLVEILARVLNMEAMRSCCRKRTFSGPGTVSPERKPGKAEGQEVLCSRRSALSRTSCARAP